MPASKKDEWVTVSEETATRVIFDAIGDVFEGTYVGQEDITHSQTGETWTQYHFRGADGVLYGINAGYSLRSALDKVSQGDEARITYVKDVQTGQPSPMKDFTVAVRAH